MRMIESSPVKRLVFVDVRPARKGPFTIFLLFFKIVVKNKETFPSQLRIF